MLAHGVNFPKIKLFKFTLFIKKKELTYTVLFMVPLRTSTVNFPKIYGVHTVESLEMLYFLV